LHCHRTFIWKAKHNSVARRQHWFRLWVTESCSVRLLCKLSGYSTNKINRIINYWLGQVPKEQIDYEEIRYVIYDATYFHKDGCVLNLMNATNQNIIAHTYVKKESFRDSYSWFMNLKHLGLNPVFITTDGERSIMRAMKLVWPETKLQRCLYHLQHEGMRWLRTYPKTEAGKELRKILSKLSRIKTGQERDAFVRIYAAWVKQYGSLVQSLPRTDIAYKDLQRTVVLLKNALPDMFHYITNSNVHATTNALEGFHSRLKADYRRHRGLTQEHRIQYIAWYCYYQNASN
jgi:transposase-like protein